MSIINFSNGQLTMVFDSQRQTVCMHICQKGGLHLDPHLFLEKSPISGMEETKFLDVILDRKLSFVSHLKYVKKKALKALNILPILNGEQIERSCSDSIDL